MAAGFKTATVTSDDVAATLTNYPTYVDLSRLGITTLAEAQSVRVYAESGKSTEWAREIVSVTEMHVKVPSLTSTVEMYVDWDGIRADYAVTDTYGRNNVWSVYLAVYHLESLTTDSTGNGYTLTNNNSVAASSSGKFGGGAADFGATNTNKTLSVSNNLGIDGGNCSISAWHAPHSATGTVGGVAETTSQNTDVTQSMWYHGGVPASYNSRSRRNVTDAFSNVAGSIASGVYAYCNYTYDGTNVRGYRNTTAATAAAASGNGSGSNPDITIIGHAPRFGVYFTGKVDEVRFASSVTSANWITTEYNNQNSYSTFYSVAAVAGGSAAQAARRGAVMMM